MFFFFSKILTLFLFPLPLTIIIGILTSFFLVKKWKSRLFYMFPFLFLWFFSTNFTAGILMEPLEDAYPPIAKNELPEVENLVVLGGMVNNLTRYPGNAELNGSADRITESILIYKLKKAKKIIYTGGSGSLFFNEVKESDLALNFLLSFDVPKEDIILETESRNTRENAIYTTNLLNNKDDPIILVTSAFHMRRSIREFENLGYKVIPYPTDYKTVSGNIGIWESFTPKSGALETTTVAIKEWIGIFAYFIF